MTRKAIIPVTLVIVASVYLLLVDMPVPKTVLERPGEIDSESRTQLSQTPTKVASTGAGSDNESMDSAKQSLSSANISEIFQARADYLPHIEQHYPRALAGDPESQYLVWSLMNRCHATRSVFASRTLGEIIHQLHNPSPGKIAQFERLSIRCGALYETGYENFPGWRSFIDNAAGAGQPLAMMHEGVEALQKGDKESAAELLLAGIGTGDPFAIVQIAILGPLGAIDDVDAAAWMITACTLGVDCTADSTVMFSLCEFSTECGVADSMNDTILREYGQDFLDQAQMRSDEKLDVIKADGFTALEIEWRPQDASN